MSATLFCWESVKNDFLLNINHLLKNLENYSLDQLKVDLQNPTVLLEYYKNTDALVLATVFMVTLVVIHCVMGELTRNYSQVGK